MKTLACLLLIVGISRCSQAQVFHVQAGSSSLFKAHGGSVAFEAPGYEGAVGGGLVDGRVELGGILRTDFRGYHFTLGDDTIDFDLPTDTFSFGHYFYGRGVGIARKVGRFKFSGFGGTTSSTLGAPYFRASLNQDPFAMFSVDAQLSKEWSFRSRSLIADKLTFLNGVEWSPSKTLSASASAGMGANAPYGAVAFSVERPKYSFKASYISADDKFRRISAQSPLVTESDRENLMLMFHPGSRFTLTFARSNVLSPITKTQPTSFRAAVNQASASLNLFQFRFGTGVYQSVSRGVGNIGLTFSASRRIGQRLEAGFDYYKNTSDLGRQFATRSLGGRIREVLTQKFSLTQYVTRSSGQTSFNFGGEFNTYRLSIGVSHETDYVPLRPVTAGGPFLHVYNVTLRFRPFGNVEFSGQTNVAPDGSVKYTAAASDYLYRYAGLEAGTVSLRIPKYVVKGIVVDESGAPVPGAALQINGQLAFTDNTGRFMVRLSKKGTESFQVLLDEFLTIFPYEVVSAPNSADAAPEDEAKDVRVIVRRGARGR